MKSIVIGLSVIITFIATAPAKAAGRDDVIIGTVIGGIIGYAVGRDDEHERREREREYRPPVQPPVQPVLICESRVAIDSHGHEYIQRNCWTEYR